MLIFSSTQVEKKRKNNSLKSRNHGNRKSISIISLSWSDTPIVYYFIIDYLHFIVFVFYS